MRLIFILITLYFAMITITVSQVVEFPDKTNAIKKNTANEELITDYHVHIQSPEMGNLLSEFCGKLMPCDPEILKKGSSAADLLPKMKNSPFNRLVILSTAYQAGMPEFTLSIEDQKALTRSENAYIAEQVSGSEHLLGFFSVNPLSSYALEESGYWMKSEKFSGLKLHFANSDVDLGNPDHIKKIQTLLDFVDQETMTILIHLRTRDPEYGQKDVDIFFEKLLPHISNARIIIAHAGGWGGYDDTTHSVLENFIERMNNNSAIRDKLYLGVGAVITPTLSEERKSLFIKTFRTLNIENWIFGSDWFPVTNDLGHGLYLSELIKAGLTEKEATTLISKQLPFVD